MHILRVAAEDRKRFRNLLRSEKITTTISAKYPGLPERRWLDMIPRYPRPMVLSRNLDQNKAMKKVVISPTVEIAMSSLDSNGVRRIQGWFDYLQRWDEDEGVRRNSLLLDSIPGVYVMRTTTDLRIFFRIDGDTVTVLDVAKTPAILASGGIDVSGSTETVHNSDLKVK